jgi:iron complex transport system ATP-binding protein
MSEAALTSRELHIGYPGRAPISGPLDLNLRPGRLTCLLGPNGAGKTTLLRTLSGMLPALGGEVLLDGTDLKRLPPRRRAQRLAVVLTDRVTVGMLDVWTLVSLGRQPHTDWRGKLSVADARIVDEAIEAAGASDLVGRNVAELSDGERQRVMLARALAQEPGLLILDEITAFLDLPRRLHVMRLLRDIARKRDISVLVSTHDLDLALRLADEVWLASSLGEFFQGPPEELVLRGDFGRVFESEELHFDAAEGTFRIDHDLGASAAVQGDDLPAKWTRRALERLGYRVVDWSSPADLRVARRANGTETYEVQHGGVTRNHPTLADLLEALRQPQDE